MNIRDLLTTNNIYDKIYKTYHDTLNITNNNISKIIQIYENYNLIERRNLHYNLLLNSNNKNWCYINDILTDIHINTNDYQTILNTLTPIQINMLNKKKDENNNSFKNNTEISYEKQIRLLKCDKVTKNKAYEKLKEINSNKGSESNCKAQQYLDGLLKIPFGIFKKEEMFNFLEVYLEKMNTLLSSISIINLINVNIETTSDIINIFKKIFKLVKQNYLTKITGKLKKLKIKQLTELLKHYQPNSKTQKKSDLIATIIDLIVNNQNNLYEYLLKHYYHSDIKNIYNLLLEWQSYLKKRKTFLIEVEKKLDKSVYGMKESKLEIKRIIAQWINGINKGYIIGFEGPPGTGKTTLSRMGISRCLIDKNGTQRPFVFITLGGSSNGSTLERHNYTYVGSTWGKITDALITSECMNPIIYIDEVDKISNTEQGRELIGILTHITDTSQNEEFYDKYFSGVKLDISKCLIIFSYNDPSKIDKILLDRIHRIKVNSLNVTEKLKISNLFLIPNILKNSWIKSE